MDRENEQKTKRKEQTKRTTGERPLVLDKGLLEIIMQNRQKLKQRFSYRLEMYGKEHDQAEIGKIAQIMHIGRNTIEEIKQIYVNKFKYKPGAAITNDKITGDAMNIGLPPKVATGYISGSKAAVLRYTKVTISFQRG